MYCKEQKKNQNGVNYLKRKSQIIYFLMENFRRNIINFNKISFKIKS